MIENVQYLRAQITKARYDPSEKKEWSMRVMRRPCAVNGVPTDVRILAAI
uniref:Uncharacterized protein LOC105129583 n=1 Tax=Rhizophora mucronata TaxID=61149 RepID=A0A2P2J222_RHIMU